MILNKTLETKEYFTIDDYIQDGLLVEGGISIIVGGRNTGKTTGTFLNWLEKADPENMLFYIRNTLKEIDSYKTSFNAEYGDKFQMTSTAIWRVKKVELINKKTKELETHYRKDYIIGYVASLNGTDGWRSANFQNVKYIFSDEFNQIGNSLNFEKFMTLWTSILRTKDHVYTCLIGNRDDASSEIIVELGIDILVPENHQGDWIVPLLPHNQKFKDKCFFIDIDDNRFLNNANETVWKALGRRSEAMGKYYDRGYKSYDNADCRSLDFEILKEINWKFSYDFMAEIKLVVGHLNDVLVVHHDKSNQFHPKLKYASIEQAVRKVGHIDIMDNPEWVFNTITGAIKNENIIYTSIHAKENINWFIDILAKRMKDAGFNL